MQADAGVSLYKTVANKEMKQKYSLFSFATHGVFCLHDVCNLYRSVLMNRIKYLFALALVVGVSSILDAAVSMGYSFMD